MFLGTGSAEPSKYRGPSAILLSMSGDQGSVLLDCGEGTWGAMRRWLGPQGAKQQVNRLRCVWVSHRHADHCLGLPGVLAARHKHSEPLLVVGPHDLKPWLAHLEIAHGYRSRFVHCRHFTSGTGPGHGPSDPHHCHTQHKQLGCGPQGAGLVLWQSVAVHHCSDAFGFVLQHREGWKVVYSGDTRPCEALVAAARHATLLIHEATFEPDLLHQATSKRHSTSQEALEVAHRAQAYRTILTHFSQRYPRVPAGLGLTLDSEAVEAGAAGGSAVQGAGCAVDVGGCGGCDSGDEECDGQLGLVGEVDGDALGKDRQDTGAPDKPKALTPVSQPSDTRHTIAFDGMCVPLSALPWLPALVNPYLDAVLSVGREVQ